MSAELLHAPIPITDPKERLALFDMFAQFDMLQEKQQEILAKLNDSELGKKRAKMQAELDALNKQLQESSLGKEVTEIDTQKNDLNKKFIDFVGPISKAHGCEGGQITRSLELKNCPAKKP